VREKGLRERVLVTGGVDEDRDRDRTRLASAVESAGNVIAIRHW
jgi:hypothetical protein